VHLRAAGEKALMTFELSPGQRHEALGFAPLMAGGAVKRSGRGRPKRRPGRVVGDKASSSGKIRAYLRTHGIRITIPHKVNEHRSGPFDRAIYRLREQVEQLINRLKQHRRVATRYEKCAANYRAMWLIAADSPRFSGKISSH
jgi:transposase